MSFIQRAIAFHEAQAAITGDLAVVLKRLNAVTGSDFSIEGANGGYKLESKNGSRSHTKYLKKPVLVAYIEAFTDGFEYARTGKAATTATASTYRVKAAAEESGNDEFDGLVWGMTDEGIDDSFTGKEDGYLYYRFDFDADTKDTLKESGFEDLANKFVGAILCFDTGDSEDAPAYSYFTTTTELDAEWKKVENDAGGRADSEVSEEGAVPEDVDSDSDSDIDDVIWEILDSEAAPKPADAAGDQEDVNGYYELHPFTSDFLAQIEEYGDEYSEPLKEYAGIIVYYRSNEANETVREISYYETKSDLDAAWKEDTEGEA